MPPELNPQAIINNFLFIETEVIVDNNKLDTFILIPRTELIKLNLLSVFPYVFLDVYLDCGEDTVKGWFKVTHVDPIKKVFEGEFMPLSPEEDRKLKECAKTKGKPLGVQ